MKIEKKQKEFKPASEGWHVAVLADVVDLGIRSGRFGDKHKVRLVFLVDETDNNKPLWVSDFCSVSLHESSKLARYIRVLTGKMPGKAIETDDLIGHGCRIKTEHHLSSDDRIFANVIACLPLKPEDNPIAIPADFVREKDKAQPKSGSFKNYQNLDVSDEDVQFPIQTQYTRAQA